MNKEATDLDRVEEEILTDTVSDEALEATVVPERMCNPTGQLYYSNC